MTRLTAAAGFHGPAAPVSCGGLLDAVAASLAVASLSLCRMVTLTVLSSSAGMAMPFPT
jgi:hypothetical protein